MPGRPPAKALTVAMQKAAYSPTLGSTPAITENANASGIRASATTVPASTSPRTLKNHVCLICDHITTSLELIKTPPHLNPKKAEAGEQQRTHALSETDGRRSEERRTGTERVRTCRN